MPRPKKGARLGSNPAHQKHMLSNLAVSLFEHGRITTTEAKAKALRPFAEKLITKAKKGSVQDRRIVLRHIEDREVVHRLFADIAPRFADRNGGYTRILKIGPRNGDGAPMALIELVEGAEAQHAETVEAESSRRRIRRPSRKGATADAEATEDAALETEADDFEADDAADETEEVDVADGALAEADVADGGDDDDAGEDAVEDTTETPGDAHSETTADEPGETEKES